MTDWKDYRKEKPTENIRAVVTDEILGWRPALAMYHPNIDRWYLLDDDKLFSVHVTHYLEIPERESI